MSTSVDDRRTSYTVAQTFLYQGRHHRAHVAAETYEFLNRRGAQHEVLRVGRYEDRLDFRIESFVKHREFKLIGEIRKRAHTSNHDARSDLPGKLYDHAIPDVDVHRLPLGGKGFHHLHPFIGGESISFLAILGDDDLYFIVNTDRSFYQVQVSVGRRIEGAGHKDAQHGHIVSALTVVDKGYPSDHSLCVTRSFSVARPLVRIAASLFIAIVFYTPTSIHPQVPNGEAASDDRIPSADRPDWIPVGSVSSEVERRAVETRVRLQSRFPEIQRDALRSIRGDIERYGRAQMRIATVPLVIELLDMEYRILETPVDYRVDSATRIDALILLADIGGNEARGQLRATLRTDIDSAVRVSAAQLLAAVPGEDPDGDLQAVAEALGSAARRGQNDGEIRRLVAAARVISRNAWSPEYPPLLDALITIASGPYSSSSRSEAMSLLEELADR